MFSFDYNSYEFFFDLLALSLLLLPVYALTPSLLARRLLLTLGGVYMVYFIAPRLALFYILFWSAVWLMQRMLAKNDGRGIPACIAVTLLPMLAWKVFDNDFNFAFNIHMNTLLRPLSWKIAEADMMRTLVAGIGLSFATFRALDLLIKTYLSKIGQLPYEKIMFYGLFPPVQIVGPIIEYEEIADQGKKISADDVYQGLLRIAGGFLKVFVAAEVLKNTSGIFKVTADYSVPELWLNFLLYPWFFYFNFSGYSDMAIGIARAFGFTLKENFSFPFFRRSPQEFWNNWHMSLSRFAQRYVFVPAGGYRPETRHMALFATMMLIAFWHDVSLSMLLFGIYHFGLLYIHEKHAAFFTKLPQPVAVAGTFFAVMLSFPLLGHDLDSAMTVYKALLGVRP